MVVVRHLSSSSTSIACILSSSFVIVLFIFGSVSNGYHYYNHTFTAYAAYTKATVASGGPTLNDPNLKVEALIKGLDVPTSMAFLGPDDILVLEKNTGTVVRIADGEILKKPLLHVGVAQGVEYGMLGIALAKNTNSDGSRNVFLYYTETDDGSSPHNRLYRYELTSDNSQLLNPKLLLDLPAISSSTSGENNNHNGGKVLIGPDNNVYTVIGDVGGHQGQAQNVKDGDALDGTSGIFRITQDGQPVANNPLIGSTSDHSSKSKHGKGGVEGGSSSAFLNYYYAYGIRNSFGVDFDPVTGKLWDTENGPTFGDEINLVNPGFNSGWIKIQGLAHDANSGDGNPAKGLVAFGGKGIYRDPEFTWQPTIGPTALKFFNSAKLGSQYQNDMFVGDVNTGSLYHFKLNQQRDGLALTGPLADKVANTPQESQQAALGHGFGTITDLQVGPDGYLYVITFAGSLYRIVPSSSSSSNSLTPS
ncbi:MAG: PQQ-dependent sugar dehydrogenase [Thermoproteota archaeon]|nr:PQQ-dependent sugar dehydrogenase [Thermoproteota archaeon]